MKTNNASPIDTLDAFYRLDAVTQKTIAREFPSLFGINKSHLDTTNNDGPTNPAMDMVKKVIDTTYNVGMCVLCAVSAGCICYLIANLIGM